VAAVACRTGCPAKSAGSFHGLEALSQHSQEGRGCLLVRTGTGGRTLSRARTRARPCTRARDEDIDAPDVLGHLEGEREVVGGVVGGERLERDVLWPEAVQQRAEGQAVLPAAGEVRYLDVVVPLGLALAPWQQLLTPIFATVFATVLATAGSRIAGNGQLEPISTARSDASIAATARTGTVPILGFRANCRSVKAVITIGQRRQCQGPGIAMAVGEHVCVMVSRRGVCSDAQRRPVSMPNPVVIQLRQQTGLRMRRPVAMSFAAERVAVPLVPCVLVTVEPLAVESGQRLAESTICAYTCIRARTRTRACAYACARARARAHATPAPTRARGSFCGNHLLDVFKHGFHPVGGLHFVPTISCTEHLRVQLLQIRNILVGFGCMAPLIRHLVNCICRTGMSAKTVGILAPYTPVRTC
jgi:hypothetical protein